jgi:glycosyltransferase involved in cell wall biosynthesis
MIAAPTISVIVPTYQTDRRAAIVEPTLRSLLAQDYPAELVEIVVVDDPGDDSRETVERVTADATHRGGPAVRLVRLDERLPAVKRNRGLKLATGDIVFFINDDLRFAPNVLSEHVATHQRWDEDIAVLGYCPQSPDMATTPFIEFYEPFAYQRMREYVDGPTPYQFFWSMNLSMPRHTMLGRNLVFHEYWAHIGHEDVELGWRWTRAGLKAIYNPRAVGEHYHPHTVAGACQLQETIGRGLRDLEVLVPDDELLERYGIFSWGNRPRAVARGLARRALFNNATAPLLTRWLDARTRNTTLTRWCYWKVLLHSTNYGYRSEPQRTPVPLTTRPVIRQEANA